MNNNLSATFKQLCSLVSPFEKPENAEISIDWEQVIFLAKQHRISAVLLNEITARNISVPIKLLEQLKEQVKSIKFKMLALSRELVQITKQFKGHNIRLLSLKGPIQSIQVFGDLSLKHSRDLDLLVDETDVENSIDVLEKMGYEIQSPYRDLNSKQKHYFLKNQNQIVFFHPKRKIQVELHWRLFANSQLLDFEFSTMYDSSEQILLVGERVNGLSRLHMILYLCTHGAKHEWAILYWLVELCFLIKKDSNDLEKIYGAAKNNGVARPFLQFIGLSKWLFEIKVPTNIEKQLSTKIIKNLINRSLIAIQDHQNLAREKGILAYIAANAYRMKLRRNLAYKVGTFKLISVYDFQILKLPSSLFFLYYLLRPILWCKRYLLK